MRPDGCRKAMKVLNRFELLTYFFGNLVVRWKKASELSHQLPPVIIVNYTYHWKSPNRRPKIAFTSCMVKVISSQGRWNVWVSGLHLL